MLRLAAKVALPNHDSDRRNFWLGAIGIRKDKVSVSAQNGAIAYFDTIPRHQLIPNSHAEGRVLRKLGRGGIIFVSRVSRKDRTLAMAMPCQMCQVRIRSAKVEKVYYSINESQYGLWIVEKDYHRVFSL